MEGEKPPFCLGNVHGKQPQSPSHGHAALNCAGEQRSPGSRELLDEERRRHQRRPLPATAPPVVGSSRRDPGSTGPAVGSGAVPLPLDILVPGSPGLRPDPSHRSSLPRRSSRSLLDLPSRTAATSPAEGSPRRHGPSPPLPPHVQGELTCPRAALPRGAPEQPAPLTSLAASPAAGLAVAVVHAVQDDQGKGEEAKLHPGPLGWAACSGGSEGWRGRRRAGRGGAG